MPMSSPRRLPTLYLLGVALWSISQCIVRQPVANRETIEKKQVLLEGELLTKREKVLCDILYQQLLKMFSEGNAADA